MLSSCLAFLLLSYIPTSHSAAPRPPNSAFPYNPGFDIQEVAALAKSLPSHSWEFGTAAETLLELYDPEISVFSSGFLSKTPGYLRTHQGQIQSLEYAASVITIGTGANALADGDGAVGDPCSLGTSAVLLGDYLGSGEGDKYSAAATEQIEFTVGVAPRWENGAISHRVEVPELWSDFIYMAPPFLAYYALHTGNLTLMKEAVEQCALYRQVMQMPGDNGVWEHIIGPPSPDPGLWSTGNGWAAAGMTRILAAISHTPHFVYGKDSQNKYEQWRPGAIDSLSSYIREIVDGAIASPMDDGLLRNYLNDTSGDGHGFGEISGSTLVASVVYRMAVLQPKIFAKRGSDYLRWAEGIRKTMGNGEHVTYNGTAIPTVNPLGWFDTTPFTAGSPEGQNFVVQMYVAWRDCRNAGVC